MKPTSADRDDFQAGPLGLWALGLAGATRSRLREDHAVAEVGVEVVSEDEGTDAFASAGDAAAYCRDS